MTMTRRDLLRTGWKVGASLLAVAAGWTTYEALRPLSSAGATGKLTLGSPTDFTAGTATYFGDGRLWLVNASGHFFALSQKCPHLGCRVPFCESSGRFECPCHGSMYDLGGEYIAGPAPRGMDRFDLALQGDTLVADTSKLIPGPPRGAQRFLTAPRGPSCISKG